MEGGDDEEKEEEDWEWLEDDPEEERRLKPSLQPLPDTDRSPQRLPVPVCTLDGAGTSWDAADAVPASQADAAKAANPVSILVLLLIKHTALCEKQCACSSLLCSS